MRFGRRQAVNQDEISDEKKYAKFHKKKFEKAQKNFENTSNPFIQIFSGRILLDQRYELGNILGEGGFGVVYQARDLKTNQKVAVKIGRESSENIIKLHQCLIGKTNEYLWRL